MLERTIFQELENGMFAGLFGQAGPQQASGGVPTTAGTTIRSASPNSISIANALSLFAANCLHQYTANAVSGATAVTSLGSASSPAVNSVLFGADQVSPVPLAKKLCTNEDEEQMKISEALDNSTTSEESDEEPSPASTATAGPKDSFRGEFGGKASTIAV